LKKLVLLPLLAAAALTATAADAMNVKTFVEKADALEKKGVMALMSSDYRLLKKEVETAAAALKDERLAAAKAGRRAAYCPTSGSGLNSKELLAAFRTIPPQQRERTEVKDALRALLARKYPCRG
jgi:asparagine synthetase A